jgi:hypothetical protein
VNVPELATVAASATVVVTGFGALMRIIFKAIMAVRINTIATDQLSVRVHAMNGVEMRLDRIEHRLDLAETRR